MATTPEAQSCLIKEEETAALKASSYTAARLYNWYGGGFSDASTCGDSEAASANSKMQVEFLAAHPLAVALDDNIPNFAGRASVMRLETIKWTVDDIACLMTQHLKSYPGGTYDYVAIDDMHDAETQMPQFTDMMNKFSVCSGCSTSGCPAKYTTNSTALPADSVGYEVLDFPAEQVIFYLVMETQATDAHDHISNFLGACLKFKCRKVYLELYGGGSGVTNNKAGHMCASSYVSTTLQDYYNKFEGWFPDSGINHLISPMFGLCNGKCSEHKCKDIYLTQSESDMKCLDLVTKGISP